MARMLPIIIENIMLLQSREHASSTPATPATPAHATSAIPATLAIPAPATSATPAPATLATIVVPQQQGSFLADAVVDDPSSSHDVTPPWPTSSGLHSSGLHVPVAPVSLRMTDRPRHAPIHPPSDGPDPDGCCTLLPSVISPVFLLLLPSRYVTSPAYLLPSVLLPSPAPGGSTPLLPQLLACFAEPLLLELLPVPVLSLLLHRDKHPV